MIERHYKIILQLVVVELGLLLAGNLLLQSLPHREIDTIYLATQNVLFLLTVFTWYNFKLSTYNRLLVGIFGVWITINALFSFATNFITESNINNIQFWENVSFVSVNLLISMLSLFISIYLILFVVIGIKQNSRIIRYAALGTVLATVFILFPLTQSKTEIEYTDIFKYLYLFSILSFSTLVVFWQQYSKFHFVLSEHMPTILTIFSAMVANEIFQDFSIKNDLIYHTIGMYFNLLLYITMLVVWLIRLEYLKSPIAKENEYYNENYNLVPEDYEKPRQSWLKISFFNKKYRQYTISILSLLLVLGLSLFLFNHFEVFIKLNILILIIALVASVIGTFVYWHRRWYQSVGILFKKRK